MNIDDDALTRAEVAWLLGMSDSWVRDRMQAGDLPRPGETAEQYVEAFVEYRVRKLTKGGDGDGINFEVERARLTKEQADAKAMENAKERRELASLPDMMSAMSSVIEVSLARLMRVPAIVAMSDEALKAKIETAMRDALEELSSTRVIELVGESLDGDDESADDVDVD